MKRCISYLITVLIIFNLIVPVANANDDAVSTIGVCSVTATDGGVLEEGVYTWHVNSPTETGHDFVYTLNIPVNTNITANTLNIIVLKSLLYYEHDSIEIPVDACSMNIGGVVIPEQSEIDIENPPMFYYQESDDTYIIRNYTDITSGTDLALNITYKTQLSAYFCSSISCKVFEPTIGIDGVFENITGAPLLKVDLSNVDSKLVFINATILMRGRTEAGTVKKFNAITLDSSHTPVLVSDIEKQCLIDSGVTMTDNIYYINITNDEYIKLYNGVDATYIKTSMTVDNSSRTVQVSKTDPWLGKDSQKKASLALPIDSIESNGTLTNLCLFLGAFTTAREYLNGYWGELGAVNTLGYNQYETEKLHKTLDSEGTGQYKLDDDKLSIKAQGKVYDYYNDSDLGGGNGCVKAAFVQTTIWDSYYFGFNDAISAYYKEHNKDFYDAYFPRVRDTSPDSITNYSQSFGTVNPLYIGSCRASALPNNPINRGDTSYGLFGVDNSYNIVNGVRINSKDRIKAILNDKTTIGNRTIANRAATLGLLGNHLGSNGEILLNTVDSENLCDDVVSPLFNEDFLSGDNIYNAAVGAAFDATYKFERTEKIVNNKRTYVYTLAQDRRFFFDEDGNRITELYKRKSGASPSTTVYKELMPLNFMMDDKEYTNAGYAQRIDVPFVLPEDDEKYTMSVKADDCAWVYLDGQLIIDLGGINYVYDSSNNIIEGELKFRENKAIVNFVRTESGFIKNYESTFEINDGKKHTLTFVQLDDYTGEGCLFVETTLPLESAVPVVGDPKSSYEVESRIKSPNLTENLGTFVDSLNITNKVFIDAPHTAGEMNITTNNGVSLYSDYKGTYKDRSYYENNGWAYVDNEAVVNPQVDLYLGRNETHAALGLVYPGQTEIESNAYQKSESHGVFIDSFDASSLFNTTLTNYQGTGMYSYSKFLLWDTSNQYKHLVRFVGTNIQSMEYPGNDYGNFVWSNKTLIESVLKTEPVTITKTVTNSPYELLLSTPFTFKVHYMNIPTLFGVSNISGVAGEDTYNGQPCITDTFTLYDGQSVTFNVPVGVHYIIEEVDVSDYIVVTPVSKTYDYTVLEGVSQTCPYINDLRGIYAQTKSIKMTIQWVDYNNVLSLRPNTDVYFTPYDCYHSDNTLRNTSLLYVMFKGNDDKWYKLSDAVNESRSTELYNAYTDNISADIHYDINETYTICSGLPKYALPYIVENVGSEVLTEGQEMVYGFMQKPYETYVIDDESYSDEYTAGIQEDNDIIIDTLYGTITINKQGIDSRGNRTPLDNAEFNIFATQEAAQLGIDAIAHLKTSDGTATTKPIPIQTYWIKELDVLGNYEPNDSILEIPVTVDSVDSLNTTVNIDDTLAERDLKIEKVVDMNYGNLTHNEYNNVDFEFSIDLDGLVVGTKYEIVHTVNGVDTIETFVGQSGVNKVDFTIRNNDSVIFKMLPVGVIYKITEKPTKFYKSSYEISGDMGSIISKSNDSANSTNKSFSTVSEVVNRSDSNIVVRFTNVYSASDYVLPAAGVEDRVPFIIVMSCGLLACVLCYMFVSKRRIINT